jgi:hypothetical protein
MKTLVQLETAANELAAAVKGLTAQCRSSAIQADSGDEATRQNLRDSILGNVASIQTLLQGPEDFLEELAKRVCS